MRKAALLAMGFSGLLALSSFAAQSSTPPCCAKAKHTAHDKTAKHEGLKCTLTDKSIEKCCCVEKDGKLYCTLAKKTLESCCCVHADAKETSR